MIYIPVVCVSGGPPHSMFPYAYCLKPTRDPNKAWADMVEDANNFIKRYKEDVYNNDGEIDDHTCSIDCYPLEKWLVAEFDNEVRRYEVNFFREDDACYLPECELVD